MKLKNEQERVHQTLFFIPSKTCICLRTSPSESGVTRLLQVRPDRPTHAIRYFHSNIRSWGGCNSKLPSALLVQLCAMSYCTFDCIFSPASLNQYNHIIVLFPIWTFFSYCSQKHIFGDFTHMKYKYIPFYFKITECPSATSYLNFLSFENVKCIQVLHK